MIYPRYMIVNKTNYPIECQRYSIKPHSNDYFYSHNDKVSFSIPQYKVSEDLNITNIGLSGVLKFDFDPKSIKSPERLGEIN